MQLTISQKHKLIAILATTSLAALGVGYFGTRLLGANTMLLGGSVLFAGGAVTTAATVVQRRR
jgi:hypothetical protein